MPPARRPPAQPSRRLGVAVALAAIALGGIAGLLLYLAVTPSPQPAPAAGQPKGADSETTGPIARPTGSPPDVAPRPPASGAATPIPTVANSGPGGASPPAGAVARGSGDPRVEQALRTLANDEDRVGQLLMLGWAGNSAEQARETIRDLRPGGIILIDNTDAQARATAINAALPRIVAEYGIAPVLIAIDHEGGSVQRIDDVPNLGSSRDFARRGPTEREACERGLTHARQLRAMGFTMNLAPVLDVNNNPNNPVIGSRSYAADPELVATLGSAYVRGLQGGGVVAVGKHFPGHGNTGVDSHLQLPILDQTVDQLERVELVPFRRAIAPPTDLAAIMSAHIVFPAVDPSRAPATLSRPVMTGLLRDRLGFDGLAVSDDMGAMKAITDNFTPTEAAVRAVQAGVDLLIVGGDLARQQASRDGLLAAVASGVISRDRLDEAVRRVLRTKVRAGLLVGAASPPEAGCG